MSQKWKGGRDAAQKRYRELHAEEIKIRRREEYKRNKKKYRERSSKYRKENPEKVFEINARWQRDQRKKCREEVITGYGHKCICCKENETLFLEIHHPKGDGKKDRARTGGNTLTFYKWLIRENFPSGYDLLCANCHRAIHQSKDHICPHKKKDPS